MTIPDLVQNELDTHESNVQAAKTLANVKLQQCITDVNTQLETYLEQEKLAVVRRIISVSNGLPVDPSDVLVCVITC